MTSRERRLFFAIAIVGALISLPLFEATAQENRTLVYEFGPSMTNLMLEQEEYQGASPAELEGMREGIEQQLAETPISVTLRPDGTCTFDANGQKQDSTYEIAGLKLKIKNVRTGEFVEIGFFSKDKKKLTVMDRYILDLADQ
ncbi:MAG TPA: hypothetical protein VMV90_03115 [Rectinemataceae bacterium]|nr:hypothetical protein [Rectinemataceae bacterium]